MTTDLVVTLTDELVAELEEAASMACQYSPEDWFTQDNLREIVEEDDAKYMALAKPYTILALLSERAELKRDAERFREIVCAVVREIPHRNMSRGNAPGHGHSIAGVWDEDNGDLAGTECAWCKAWHAASEAAMQERQE